MKKPPVEEKKFDLQAPREAEHPNEEEEAKQPLQQLKSS